MHSKGPKAGEKVIITDYIHSSDVTFGLQTDENGENKVWDASQLS